jgi:hypothetical protein
MNVGFAPVGGPAGWAGADIDYRREGLHVLSGAEIDEIDAALRHLRGLGEVDFPAITPAAFPLPGFGGFLHDLPRRLRTGRGFVLLRGLPRERYTADDMARIYFGLGAHIGQAIPQSHQGELLGHVIDVSDIEAGARGYHAGGAQRMHTDSCDVVALMCLRGAKSGGASRIVSAVEIHDRLARGRPDLLELLYAGYTFRRMERDAELGDGVLVRPVSIFARNGEEVSCYISGSYPRRAVAAGDAVLSAAQEEALDEIQRLAEKLYLDMSIGEGDIQFLNNRLMLHGRTDYADYPEIARRRHLLRLWLRVPEWPAMSARQAMHTPADHLLWLRQRGPLMELPSRYLAAMEARHLESIS